MCSNSEWRDVLLQYIAPDRLPKHWGGQRVDSNNDPQCREFVCFPPTPKIPKELYWKPPAGHPTKDDLTMVTVPAGTKCICPFTNVLFFLIGGKVYKSFIAHTDDVILHWYIQCDHEFTIAAFYDPKGRAETVSTHFTFIRLHIEHLQDLNHIESLEEYLPHMEQPGSSVIDHQRWPLCKAGAYHFKLGNEKAWIKAVYVNTKLVFLTRDDKGADDDILMMS